MTDSAAPGESSVDQLRRRARRRLVGSAVLALIAAISLPMIFEKEPPPLPDEVDIRIPPIDKTPFDPKPIGVLKESSKEMAKEVAKSAPQVLANAAPIVSSPAPAVVVAPMAEKKSEPKLETKTETKPAVKAEAKIEPKIEAKSEPKKETAKAEVIADDGPKNAPVAGDFAVQLIAVRDADSAREVLEKARKLGYNTAYRETIDVSNGKVTRVRTGPYKEKAFAEKIRNKLATEGFEPVVIAIK